MVRPLPCARAPARTTGPQYEGQVQVRKLNVDDAPEVAAAFGVRGIPTLILFKKGLAHSRLVGLHDETQLSSWVRAAL